MTEARPAWKEARWLTQSESDKHEFTIMHVKSSVTPRFRVECSCGFAEDYFDEDKARWFALNHARLLRMRPSKRRELMAQLEVHL